MGCFNLYGHYGQKNFMHVSYGYRWFLYSTCINLHLKAFYLPIKTYWMRDMGPGVWKVWRASISIVSLKIWFQAKQRISHRKNDLNLQGFENFGFQITRFLWWVPVGRQEYRMIFILFLLLSYVVCSQIWLNILWMMATLATSQIR